jgi:hypothetical protein
MKRLSAWAAAFLCVATILTGVSYLATAPTAVRANLLQGPTGTAPVAPTGSCSQSTAFFARVWALPATLDGTVGGTAGPTNHLAAYDNFICGLVTDTVIDLMDALYIFATNTATGTNTAVADLNLLSSNYPITAHGSPTFTANAGYTGVDSSTTVYLDTPLNPSTYGGFCILNSCHVSVHSFTATQATATGGAELDASSTGTSLQLLIYYSDSTSYGYGNTTSAVNCLPGTAAGNWIMSRTTSSIQHIIHDGADCSIAGQGAAPVSLPNANLTILARSDHSTGGGRQIGEASIGAGIDATRAANFRTRLCTYMTAVHGSC